MNLTKDQISTIAQGIGLDYARFMAFISVESGGLGFSTKTGKIIIQFEPTWFHRYLTQFKVAHEFSTKVDEHGRKVYVLSAGGITLDNGIEGQDGEWEAFNKAFAIHPTAAMLSTSIGLMQIMGFHYKELGFGSVGDMWDSFKASEYNQVLGGAKFIQSQPALFKALVRRDWAKVAYYYNGENYKSNNYDVHLANAYAKYST
jgi:hypothetical protein